MTTTLLLERDDEHVAVLRLNRPERLNAINVDLADEMRAACTRLRTDSDVRAVVLTGAGRGFCAGIDMRGFGPLQPTAEAPVTERIAFQEMMASLPNLLRSLPQPVIAAVNGPAFGAGLALVLGCDLRICGESAAFGNAAIAIGLSGTEMGMSYHLPRIVGTSVATDWMITGRTVAADEALRTGLVSSVAPDARLMEVALETARRIASHSPLAVQLTKRTIQANVDAPSLDAALEVENRNQVITHASPEAAAARAAWEAR